ncbi:MAG: hypothetical protein ACTSUE_23935, partial [Promethearchaeota archaeon]
MSEKATRVISDKKKMIKSISLIAIIAASILVGVFVFIKPGNPNADKVYISEIQPSGSFDDQFIELYVRESISSLDNWYVEGEGFRLAIPAITNIPAYTYITFWIGNGTNDYDASDKNVSVYYNDSGAPFLNPVGFIRVTDNKGRGIDFVQFGAVVPVDPKDDWLESDGGIPSSGDPLNSLQMWGEDLDNSTNWYEWEKTPGAPNKYGFDAPTLNGIIPVVIYSGIGEDVVFDNDSKYVGAKIVVKGDVPSWTTKDKVEEMAKYTLDYYAKLGLKPPNLGPDGVLDIHLTKSKHTESSGETDRDGSVKVSVGTTGGLAGNVSLKNCVEHEIMHTVQAKKEADGTDDWGNSGQDDAITEGMAVWGGITSAMNNYKLNWSQVMDELKKVGDHNWHDHYRNINIQSIPWPGSSNNPTRNATYNDYINLGLFMKYVQETFGNETMKKVLEYAKSVFYLKDTYKQRSMMDGFYKATGIRFNELWRKYQQWLVDGTATKDNGFPALKPHTNPKPPTSTGQTTQDGPTFVHPYGSHLEKIDINGTTQKFNLKFNVGKGSQFKITILFTLPNGTVVPVVLNMPEDEDVQIPVDPAKFKDVTVIKTRVGLTGDGLITMELRGVHTFAFIGKVNLNEIYPAMNPAEQYIEIYTRQPGLYNLSGWTIETSSGGGPLVLPEVYNLQGNSYVGIEFGGAISELDASDHYARIGIPTPGILDATTGWVVLKDDLGNVVDYVYYGGMIPPTDPIGMNSSYWLPSDVGAPDLGLPGMSLQLWGGDLDNSSNWYTNITTQERENGMDFIVYVNNGSLVPIPVQIFNGEVNEPLPDLENDMRYYDGEPVVVTSGTPAPWTTQDKIQEMVNFTLNFYIKNGFPIPQLGPDGFLDIHLTNGTLNYTTGSCGRDGSIIINVGQVGGAAGLTSLKKTVEHEIMHAVQAANSPDADHDYWGNGENDDAFSEGLAEWAGIESTMANYGITWNTTMYLLNVTGSSNWFTDYRDLNMTLFPWRNDGDHYMGMALFFKFLNETKGGVGAIVQILELIRSHVNGSAPTDENYTTAIETVVGMPFALVWHEFQIWLANGSATSANEFPALTPRDVKLPMSFVDPVFVMP